MRPIAGVVGCGGPPPPPLGPPVNIIRPALTRGPSLAAARERALERSEATARRARRDPAEVRLVAVSKTVGADRLRAAVAAGLDLLGENRVQEALGKVDEV